VIDAFENTLKKITNVRMNTILSLLSIKN